MCYQLIWLTDADFKSKLYYFKHLSSNTETLQQ